MNIADIVLYNGKIFTENEKQPWAEAVAINEETLTFVGNKAELDEACIIGENTRQIDLKGKMVIPGMIDGHTHPETIAKNKWRVTLPDAENVEDLLGFVKKYCNEHPVEEVPFFYGVSYPTTMFDDDGPNKELLDKYVSDRPVRLQDFTDHACWYNSKALELMGINSCTEETAEAPFFVRDKDNEPTGWTKEPIPSGTFENPMFEKIGWWPPKTVTEDLVMPFLDFLNNCGVICFMDGITEGEDAMKLYYDLDIEGKLNMYYEGTCQLDCFEKLDECISTLRDWQRKYRSKHVNVHTVKFFLDGTNEIGNSASLEPHYNDSTATNYGKINMSEDELIEVLLRLNDESLDLHIHVVCDRGFRVACNAYERAKKIVESKGKKWTIYMQLAHCELVHPDDMKRPAELGIIVNWSCHWSGGYFGDSAIEYLGRKRWDTMYDFTEMIDSGAVVTYSSDVIGPGEAPRANPFYGMQIAATRIDIDFPLDPQKYPGSIRPPENAKLNVEDMLRGYTIDATIPFRFEERMGSIEIGKLANLVVLNKNIFNIPVEELHMVGTEMVFFEGRRIK